MIKLLGLKLECGLVAGVSQVRERFGADYPYG
jgi:hypothetical protein